MVDARTKKESESQNAYITVVSQVLRVAVVVVAAGAVLAWFTF